MFELSFRGEAGSRNPTPKAGTGSGELGDHQITRSIRHGRSRVLDSVRRGRGTGVSLRR
jgi:hypothetical protein